MDGYHGRAVPVTEDRMRDMEAKQAKQRALREALDGQLQQRREAGGVVGMTKVQLRRMSLERARQDAPVLQPSHIPAPPTEDVLAVVGMGHGAISPRPVAPTSQPPHTQSRSPAQFTQQTVLMPKGFHGPETDIAGGVEESPKPTRRIEPAPRRAMDVRSAMAIVAAAKEDVQPAEVPRRPSDARSRNANDARKATRTVSHDARQAQVKVERLQRELDERAQEVKRMRDKERQWEEQVRALQSELRNARQHQKELARNAKPLSGPRAETAPDSLVQPAKKQQRLQPLDIPDRTAKRAAGERASPLNQTCVLGGERPISAPIAIDPIDLKRSVDKLPPLPYELSEQYKGSVRTLGMRTQTLTHSATEVILTYDGLKSFVDRAIVTAQQAAQLWALFSGQPPDSSSPLIETPTVDSLYETYGEIEQDGSQSDGYQSDCESVA